MRLKKRYLQKNSERLVYESVDDVIAHNCLLKTSK